MSVSIIITGLITVFSKAGAYNSGKWSSHRELWLTEYISVPSHWFPSTSPRHSHAFTCQILSAVAVLALHTFVPERQQRGGNGKWRKGKQYMQLFFLEFASHRKKCSVYIAQSNQYRGNWLFYSQHVMIFQSVNYIFRTNNSRAKDTPQYLTHKMLDTFSFIPTPL